MFVQAAVMWIFMWRSLESLFNRTFRIFYFQLHYDTSLNLVYRLMSILIKGRKMICGGYYEENN